ncbi:tensin-3 isoform X10 [Penaeus vannamei]|uniref:tensin-3 isoform X10 n=1 Tax=Penaeus vannamei TaxID=6689 RepID=UPI00387FA7CF
MKLPKFFENNSFTRRRLSSVPSASEGGGELRRGGSERRARGAEGGRASQRNSSEFPDRRSERPGSGEITRSGSLKVRSSTSSVRPDRSISLLSRVYGSGSSDRDREAEDHGGATAGAFSDEKKDSKHFSGFSRRFTIRPSSSKKKAQPFRRSNTLPTRYRPPDRQQTSFVQQDKNLQVLQGNLISSPTMHITGPARGDGRGMICRLASTDVRHPTPGAHEPYKTADKITDARHICTSGSAPHVAAEEKNAFGAGRVSPVSSLRQEGPEHISHYLSASEVAASEVTSCDLPFVDLASSDATPTISPYSSITSSLAPSVSHALRHARARYGTPTSAGGGAGTLPFPVGPGVGGRDGHAGTQNLHSLFHVLASFRDPNSPHGAQETYENVASNAASNPGHGHMARAPPSSDESQMSPSSVTSCSSGTASQSLSSGSIKQDDSTQKGHVCPKCQVNFLTSRQLLEHWSVFHTHDDLQMTLHPLLSSFEDKEPEVRRSRRSKEKGHRLNVQEVQGSDEVESEGTVIHDRDDEGSAWCQPNTLEAQRHVFKAKKVKKSRPCHVCHQPIVKLGSCCRVCKYLVHKACEPKEAASEAPRSFTDPARQIFYELRATAARPGPRGPSSLQGSPLSPRRRSPGGTAPPSLQPSPTLTRHAGGSPLRQDPGEATGAASPARTSSPGQLRRGGGAGPTPSQGGSPRVSQRESSPAPGAASLGTGEGSRASAPRESEGVGLTRIHHAPNNNDATATQKHPTISSRNTQSAARLNRVMAGAGGATGGGLAGEAPGPGGERPGPPGGGPKMDVVYVTERIISLAFPPALDDATYTLHLREVAHMLSSKHGDNFKVFNLSQHGEISHFLPRVMELGWADQLAPALERLCSICKALDSWITQHPQHVAVLHARGGYEKLGVVVAAYMHYSNICASTDQALDRYAMKRFFDDKIGQLYHPSQKRYVQYFAGLLSGVIRINSSPLYLHTLTLYGIPHFEPRGGCHLFIKIYQGMTPIYTSGIYNLTEQMRQVTIAFETGVQLRGDILLKAYHRRLVPASREVIFRMQFHTCAVSEKVLSFTRHDLDDACNDMRFPLDGGVELYFTHSQDERPRTVSNVSCDKSPCAIASWNSYENVSFTYEQIEEQGVTGVGGVSHTLGPLDGSLYATVTKKRPQPPASPHSPVSPHAPSVTHTPSPHGLVNGRYAASIDSGIASSNSAAAAPVSPPTSDTSRTSGESRGTAAAAVTAGRVGAGVAPPPVDARQLDELLQGMLLDIQSIPDLRPSQTPAPDIDSIRCPDFSMAPKTESRPSVTARSSADTAPPPPLSPVNGFSGSTTHDSLLDSSLSTTADEMPYHARTDSKPFSYGAVTSSPLLGRRRTASEGGEGGAQPPPSPSIHRRNSRETLGQARAGLESPRLVRRMSGSVGGTPGDAGGGSRRSPSPSPSPEPGSRGGTLGRQRSHTLTTRIMSGSETTPNSTLNRSEHTRSASRLDDTLDLSSEFHTRSLSSTGSNNLSWLQMQQLKLAERREAKLRAERAPHEARMLSELRTRMGQQQRTSTTTSRDFEDGYVSDTTLLSETSRESSPVKTLAPLTINTGGPQTSPQKPPIGHSTPARGNSAPSSPILPTRYNQQQSSQRSLPRKHSDSSHDRERPFVAVKRAHENAKPGEPGDASSALNQLQTSPHGHIQYSSYSSTTPVDGGLLTTVASSSNQSRDDSAWQSDTESSYGGNRPITPGFPPATPTTPYLNQGLPPKSPTMQRKEMGVRSPSPATSQTLRQELNGHSSPAPSLYHSQSRRSSLTSLNESSEVISSHPKFVKDISKFWYKPTITRDEAISMLKDKAPGTFVVRDSNSFPGAFGLALKVSTPPPNVTSKSSDPASELVRHFLIEPTSRGVRLKGCANEPVFGSLSALVYQHSITALALPCRLVLPERDPAGAPDSVDSSVSTSGSSSSTSQLLQQGAACNVMYLHTADTESLTGPQAVKRAVSLMLAAKITPTVVHFKVSAQGITLTDNERKLFFRRHYPVNTISHCGLDPDDRRWAQKNEEGVPVGSHRVFGFVAKKGASRTENQCHILAELEPEQPATAICNFVTKVMMTSVSRPNLV